MPIICVVDFEVGVEVACYSKDEDQGSGDPEWSIKIRIGLGSLNKGELEWQHAPQNTRCYFLCIHIEERTVVLKIPEVQVGSVGWFLCGAGSGCGWSLLGYMLV